MDLKYLYDMVENCPCGHVHSCDIKHVDVSHGAIDSLKTVLGNFAKAAMPRLNPLFAIIPFAQRSFARSRKSDILPMNFASPLCWKTALSG